MGEPTSQPADGHDASNIDNEHRVQLGMLKALCDAVTEGQPASKIHEILNQLTAYSELHFTSEELLMRMYSYPDYDDHVLDHEAMTERLNQILQRYAAGQDRVALQTANEVRDFLLGHINSRDLALSEYLITMQT
ncbi:bacteriohemerythrin [Kaarinaea lacus]